MSNNKDYNISPVDLLNPSKLLAILDAGGKERSQMALYSNLPDDVGKHKDEIIMEIIATLHQVVACDQEKNVIEHFKREADIDENILTPARYKNVENNVNAAKAKAKETLEYWQSLGPNDKERLKALKETFHQQRQEELMKTPNPFLSLGK